MSNNINERMAKAEAKIDNAHKRVDELAEKKLSKHEFNGFAQLIEAFKSTFRGALESLTVTTARQEKAITSLEVTFNNVEKFLPILIKVITFLGGGILLLLLFISSKLLGLW